MMAIVTVNRRAQRASLLLSIIPCTVVTDSNTGSGDPEQQDQSGEDEVESRRRVIKQFAKYAITAQSWFPPADCCDSGVIASSSMVSAIPSRL